MKFARILARDGRVFFTAEPVGFGLFGGGQGIRRKLDVEFTSKRGQQSVGVHGTGNRALMQHPGPAPSLGAARQFLVTRHHVPSDRVLKTFVLAMRRRGLRQQFGRSGERSRDSAMDGPVSSVGAQLVQRMTGRDDQGVRRVLAMVDQSPPCWAPDNFVWAGQLRRIFLEVPIGNRRLAPRVEPQ